MSSDILIAIIDSTGVLYDPKGINRNGLNPLVKERIGISNYVGPISNAGYLVKIEDKNRTLDNGIFISNGADFRD